MESYQQLNTLTHILSHNIKNHSANMSMLVSLVDCGQLNKDHAVLMEKMARVSEGLSETRDELGEAIKIRDNNITAEIISFKILARKVLQILDAEILLTRADISLDLGGKEVYYPKLYLESIFINLLSNALKYRSQSRVHKIVLRTYLNDNGRIVVACEDNGVGIDLAVHGHDNAHCVGLFLVKSQVESQGGSIKVSS